MPLTTLTFGAVAPPAGILKDHANLISALSQIKPNVIFGAPDRQDLEARKDHLLAIAGAVDAYILAIGRDTGHRANGIDLKLFTDVAADALSGNATYTLDEAAERVEAEMSEI